MEVPRTEWEDRQYHLESIIKKQFYNNHDDIKPGDQNVGGFISRKKYKLEEPCKCYNCEHVILVVTEYIQKECVLDRYVLAYKNLLENVDTYVHEIRNKSDIDHIVYNNFLPKDHTRGLKNENKKCAPCGTSVGEDHQDVEMETYTISTIMTIRTKILNALPMLKGVLKKLSHDEHSHYYISSRVGIIERVKNKIHSYVMRRRKDCTYEGVQMRGGNGSQACLYASPKDCSDSYDGMGCQDYTDSGEDRINHDHHYDHDDHDDHDDHFNNLEEQPQHTRDAWSCPQRGGTPDKALPLRADRRNTVYSTRLRKEAPVKFYEIIITTNQNLISLRSIHLLVEMVNLFHSYFTKFLLEKKKNEKINFMQLYQLRREEYTFWSDYNERMSYGSDNSTSFECESGGDGSNVEVHTQMGVRASPNKSYTHLGSYYDNGDTVYTKRIGDCTQRSEDFAILNGGGEIRGADYTNRVSDSGGRVVQWGTHDEECLHQGEYYPCEDVSYADRTDEVDCPPVEELQGGSTLGEKETEEMESYIKHILSCIVGEGDTYLNIELLFTLHTFQLSYLFNVLKKIILGKDLKNEYLVMLTYCGYKIQNMEIIEYCFWKLVRIFESEELPECWIVVDDKANSQVKKKYNEMRDNLRVMKQRMREAEVEMNKKKQGCLSQGNGLYVDYHGGNYDRHHYDGTFYGALNIFKPNNHYHMCNNITEVDMNKGNLHFNKNLIDKKIFSPFIEKTKKEFHHYNDIPKGYVINEIQRLRNFSDYYSCCYILKTNQKKKILMGFKKKGENKVYLYRYDKNIKKSYKAGEKNNPFFNISGFLGILICNFTGMKIKIYDNGITEKYAHFFPSFERKNIISISFESNIISELPRHFMCNIYKLNKDVKIIYENKCPVWNDEKEIYELPFYGRVKLASAKNLQLILKKCVISNSRKASFVGKTINDVIEYVSSDSFRGDSQVASTCTGRGTDGNPEEGLPTCGLPSHSPYEGSYTGEGDAIKKHVLRKKFPFDVITNNFKKKEEENFEIVNNDEEEIFLIFGKNSKDYFTLDFRHPLSSFEAFSIAISSLLKKKAVS
ncbi:Uncharacterized protein PCOAH_00050720 [Plasmodium coatneyi]|uniref:Tubby C-terminal domain-containing protein n=1 Tax=Plasmodium coatneyi TaxID=208452 RepID=A0A1B1E6F0_9APIC|nr:Uncharacterized protein PCOAH_00050720 [Plasmodium coatneyi]ANQ10596.1 Uncharacterized protein PCOAH_00050720 [Plasmodium coatneyi]